MQGPQEVTTSSLVDAQRDPYTFSASLLVGNSLPPEVEMAMQAEASRRQLETIYLNIDAGKQKLASLDSRAREAILDWQLPQRLRRFVSDNPPSSEPSWSLDAALIRELVVLEGLAQGEEKHTSPSGQQFVHAKYIVLFPAELVLDSSEAQEVLSFSARWKELEQEQNLLELLLVHESRNLALAESHVAVQRVSARGSPRNSSLSHSSVHRELNGRGPIENASGTPLPTDVSAVGVDGQHTTGRNTPPSALGISVAAASSPWVKYLPPPIEDDVPQAGNATAAEVPTVVTQRGSKLRRTAGDASLSDDDRLCAYLDSLLEQIEDGHTKNRELESQVDTSKRQAIQAREETEMFQAQLRAAEIDRSRLLAELREQIIRNEELEAACAAAAARRFMSELRYLIEEEVAARQALELEWRGAAFEMYARGQSIAKREAEAKEERSTRRYLTERANAESSETARLQSEKERAHAINDAGVLNKQLEAAREELSDLRARSHADQDSLQCQLHEARNTIALRDTEITQLRHRARELEIKLDVVASTSVTSRSVHKAMHDQVVRDGESAVKSLSISSRYKSPVAGSIRAQLHQSANEKEGEGLPKPRSSAPVPTSRSEKRN